MINLAAVGALDRCTTFEATLDVRNVRKIVIKDRGTRAFVDENLRALERNRSYPELREALLAVARRPVWRTQAIKTVRKLKRKVIKWPGKWRQKISGTDS
jgi:hypothetical protein